MGRWKFVLVQKHSYIWFRVFLNMDVMYDLSNWWRHVMYFLYHQNTNSCFQDIIFEWFLTGVMLVWVNLGSSMAALDSDLSRYFISEWCLADVVSLVQSWTCWSSIIYFGQYSDWLRHFDSSDFFTKSFESHWYI